MLVAEYDMAVGGLPIQSLVVRSSYRAWHRNRNVGVNSKRSSGCWEELQRLEVNG